MLAKWGKFSEVFKGLQTSLPLYDALLMKWP